MADLRTQLATLLGRDIHDIAIVRKTNESPPRISIIDVIAIIIQQKNRNAHNYFKRMKNTHPEICAHCEDYLFPGSKQKKTPVTNARGIVEIILGLQGRYAARIRQQAASLLVRYLGGDPKLIQEICVMRGIQQEFIIDSPNSPLRIFGETVEHSTSCSETEIWRNITALMTSMENRLSKTLHEELQRTHPWDFHKNAGRYNSLLNIGSIIEGDELLALDADEHIVSITDFIKARVTPPTWRQHGNKFKNIFAVALKKAKIDDCGNSDKPLFIARRQGEYRIVYTEADDELMTNTFHKCKRRLHGIITRDDALLQAQRKQRRIEDYFIASERKSDPFYNDAKDKEFQKSYDNAFIHNESIPSCSSSSEFDTIALHHSAVPAAPIAIRLRAKRGDTNVVVNDNL